MRKIVVSVTDEQLELLKRLVGGFVPPPEVLLRAQATAIEVLRPAVMRKRKK